MFLRFTKKKGRFGIDEIVVIKTLFLQSMYNYPDEAMTVPQLISPLPLNIQGEISES